VSVQHNRCIIVHDSHTVSMLQDQDSCLVDKCNHISPIFFEGVDHLDGRWDHVFAQDPTFVLLGIHSIALDDAQANVDDVAVVHRVVCSTCIRSAYEEAHCKGLETFGGMPGGSYSLPICLAMFGCCSPVLCVEPVKHVEKDSVWLFHADWLECFTNCFWKICKENIGEGQIHCDYACSSFWSRACVAFKLLCSLSDVHAEKSGTSSTFFGKGT
jgi:hypothetical protein